MLAEARILLRLHRSGLPVPALLDADVDEDVVAEDDVAELDGNAMDDGAVRSHGFALRPDLHGCDGFYVARWVRKPEPGRDPRSTY